MLMHMRLALGPAWLPFLSAVRVPVFPVAGEGHGLGWAGPGGEPTLPELSCSGSQLAVGSASLWGPLFLQEVLPYPGKLVLLTKWEEGGVQSV